MAKKRGPVSKQQHEKLEVHGFDLMAQLEAMLRHVREDQRELQRLRGILGKGQTDTSDRAPSDAVREQVARLRRAADSMITASFIFALTAAGATGQDGISRIGQLEVRATGVDAGPVAAAEVGPWELQSGRQFVVVRLAIRNPGRYWNCTTFQARLQTDSGTDHPAEQMNVDHTGQVHAISRIGVGERRTVHLVFRIPEDARPSAVVLQRDSDAEAECLKERSRPDPSTDPATTLKLSLNGLPARTDLVNVDGQVMARVGDLVIHPTAVRALPAIRVGKRSETAKRGYRFVAVDVQATHTGKLPNCTDFDAALTVDAGYDYSARRPDDPRLPKLNDLLAGERAAGSFVFEVEDGLTPRWLTVMQRGAYWSGCETRGRVDLVSPRVRLPLPGAR